MQPIRNTIAAAVVLLFYIFAPDGHSLMIAHCVKLESGVSYDFLPNFENCLISFTEMADFVAKQERVHVALATWSEDKLTKMGHQFKDMFRECTYRGKSCM